MSIKIGRQIDGKAAFIANRYVKRLRGMFNESKIYDQSHHDDVQGRRANRYLVKGRMMPSGMQWDVFLLDGFSVPKLVASGFVWQAEAIARARDLSLGRVGVSFSGIRGLFRPGASGLSVPLRNIERPGEDVVSVKQVKKGEVIVG